MEALPKCPDCQSELRVLLFMGVQPDGYVCEKCKILFRTIDHLDDKQKRQARHAAQPTGGIR